MLDLKTLRSYSLFSLLFLVGFGVLSALLSLIPLSFVVHDVAFIQYIFILGMLLFAENFLRHCGENFLRLSRGKKTGILLLLFLLLVGMIGAQRFAGESRFVSIWLVGFYSAVLFLVASHLGALLSQAVTRTAELVPVVLTAAVADVISVLHGPTAHMAQKLVAYYDGMMQGPEPWVSFALIKIGIPGYTIPVPLFGISDWVLLSLINFSLLRLQVSNSLLPPCVGREKIYLSIPLLGLFCCLICAQFLQIFLPAMVFIAFFLLVFLFFFIHVYKEMRGKDYIYSLFFPVLIILILQVRIV